MRDKHMERIIFRLLTMECCGQLLCWVNPRMPSYCPECGMSIYPQVRSWITIRDDNATINYKTERDLGTAQETISVRGASAESAEESQGSTGDKQGDRRLPRTGGTKKGG